jgi:hypothetical protein
VNPPNRRAPRSPPIARMGGHGAPSSVEQRVVADDEARRGGRTEGAGGAEFLGIADIRANRYRDS